MSQVDSSPWYKQFWPWFLISLPLSAVVAGTVTIIIANVTFDGLVVDDYYKQGLAINQEKGLDRMASHLGLSAELDFDLQGGTVHIRLDSSAQIPGQELLLSLLHPTRSGGDIRVALESLGEGRYRASLPTLPEAQWNLLLSPAGGQWRLQGRYPGGLQAKVSLHSES